MVVFINEIFSYKFHMPFWISNLLNVIFSLPSVKIDANEEFLKSKYYPYLTVLSAGHALHVFINGQLSGRQHIACFRNFLNQLLWIVTSNSHGNDERNFV